MTVYRDEKRGTWYAAFYYKDWNGARKHTCKRGFKTKAAAKEYETAFINALSHTTDITFDNLVANYLEDLDARMKPTTMATKRSIIEKDLLPFFRSIKISDIDTIMVRKWQNQLLSSRKPDGDFYSDTYLRSIHSQLSAILNYAVLHYGLPRNPCRLAGPIGKQKAGEMNFWTREEFNQFIATVKKPAYHLAFDILFYTGIREGELLALTPGDFLPDLFLTIKKNYVAIDGQKMLLSPKTQKSNRKIAIPQFLYDEFKDYLSKIIKINDDDRLFYFGKDALLREFRKGSNAAGLKRIRIHDLRHSHASMLIEMGFDIKVISERLGHESVKTTWDVYSHLYPEADKKVADQLQLLKDGNDSEIVDNDLTENEAPEA